MDEKSMLKGLWMMSQALTNLLLSPFIFELGLTTSPSPKTMIDQILMVQTQIFLVTFSIGELDLIRP